ncbi:MAG: prolyl oligopeptidase family serine peptidase [Ilumatobacter sp.]
MTDTFHDLDAFVGTPRLTGLELSHDGKRLVASVHTLDAAGSAYVGSVWELDPDTTQAPHRLTRGATSESPAGFTADGDLLFVAKRPAPPAAKNRDDAGRDDSGDAGRGDSGDSEQSDGPTAPSDDATVGLWLLPRAGEPRCLLTRAGGIDAVAVARDAGTVVVSAPALPTSGIDDPRSDDASTQGRATSKVSAILHDSYPVRFWDHDLGPASSRFYVGSPTSGATMAGQHDPHLALSDLTGHAPGALSDDASFDVSADGSTIVTTWVVPEAAASVRSCVARIEVATGERMLIADTLGREYEAPELSPDATLVAMTYEDHSTPDRAPHVGVAIVSIDGGDVRVLASDWGLWPTRMQWTPDGGGLVVAVDEQGRGPLYFVNASSGERRRLTQDDGTYSSHHVSADGRFVFALRSSVASPPQPVRISIADGAILAIPSPVPSPALPGTLTEVTTVAGDGTPLRSWLALPDGACAEQRAPLLLWVHGGPLGSWNAWSWRWNPWTAVARGYAVLLPDPALSTGYGPEFIERGWGAWGDAPFTDLMSMTDATIERDDIDASRTAAMGGSFGGYMANWIAGHTDRFDAIVTHASLWALDQFGPTTDAAYFWAREMTDEMANANSPHLHVDNITTPTLVIHGDRDYRVPIGEGLRMWYELVRQSADADGATPHRFLYFPDENHWILSPNNARAWYATVFAFLNQHVLGGEWEQPAELMS